MKTILLGLFLICGLWSCKKSENKTASKCYKCSLISGGQVLQTKDICTDRIDTVHFEDQYGNPYAYHCEEK